MRRWRLPADLESADGKGTPREHVVPDGTGAGRAAAGATAGSVPSSPRRFAASKFRPTALPATHAGDGAAAAREALAAVCRHLDRCKPGIQLGNGNTRRDIARLAR